MSRVPVIGAGSAGTTAAWLMAERGLQVTLVDRRPAHRAGALWINGVDLNLLERLDLGPFPDDLAFHRGGRFVMHAGSCDPTDPARHAHNIRQIVDPAPLTETRMDVLQKLLQQRALDADVDFRPESVASVGQWDGRQRVARIDGKTSTWDCIVDASGYGGVKSALHEGPHSCAAFQAVYPIVDRHAALRFLAACTEAGLWSYVVAMQRGPARIADSYQPLRCFSQRVRPHELELLMVSGIMNADAVRAGLLQHPMPLDPAVALRALRHARDLLPIAIPVARMLSLTGALLVHGLRIPKRWDTVRIHAWQKKWDQLMLGARRLAAPEAAIQGGSPPGR